MKKLKKIVKTFGIKPIKKVIDYLIHEKTPNLFKTQWWSYEKLLKFQNKRLRKMIKHAYRNFPGYQKKMDMLNIKPADIKSIEDLHKLPILNREDFQNNPDLVNEKLKKITHYTGGSTGTALRYAESYEGEDIRWKVHRRGWLWNGYHYGKKLAIISSYQGRMPGTKKTVDLIGDLSTESLKENVEILKDFKPQHLRGYVGSLYILAKYCLDNDIHIEGIESINPISENLYDFQRETMEKAFNCKVFEEYCCNDGGACAWECVEHQELHYCMERAIIECIDGEMIVTDLWNRAMPFIRYRNGDSVKFLDKKCSCGRELPLMTVKGRDNDVIISKAGVIGATYLMVHGIEYRSAKFRKGIRTIQYVQQPGYLLEVNIVKNKDFEEYEIEDLKAKLKNVAVGMDVRIKFIDTIPTTEKGKRQFIINNDKELLKKMGFLQ